MPPTFSQQRLLTLQKHAFEYFDCNWNPENGLVADTSRADSPCSIAALGFALSCYPIAVERGWLSRAEAGKRVLAALRFFAASEQSAENDASGYKGFYYHFLDMKAGRREWKCELSTIDTAILFYGFLLCTQYFERDTKLETELRERTQALVARADWRWACNESSRVALAWKPERLKQNNGFLKAAWSGYDESMVLILLALGAPEHSLPAKAYDVWRETYQWKKIYGHEYLYAGPLFIHQFAHLWVDFRDIRDNFMREKSSDYFQNSCHATHIQQEYARRNPHGFPGYGEYCWGVTASDGPGDCTRQVGGRERRFFPYRARGVPFGPDDGTLAPWGVVASLPFAPEIVLPTLDYIEKTHPQMVNSYGFRCSFNPAFPTESGYWIAPDYFGLDQGPVVLAIENYLTGLPWQLMKECRILQNGLQRGGFSGGWLKSIAIPKNSRLI